ncbi:hypothetical protein VIBNISO65_890020 [Vibrio nigripulchritudo SO65]|nr:hypothetical protein VIBNIAM115_540042 [Vibrio nigripulchritudo AM115]CCN42359.1 hypothetical protein VIBNIFTn2_290020 [Vibrio nigripulchritudo FTn2]CCN79301.1 hypothetical protein VIBNISO65_890020 [Vibrio nigripulchritudo SO65]
MIGGQCNESDWHDWGHELGINGQLLPSHKPINQPEARWLSLRKDLFV